MLGCSVKATVAVALVAVAWVTGWIILGWLMEKYDESRYR